MTTKQFGTSNEEQFIKDKAKAREIVQTVLDYGVNQAQLEQMIYLLAMELDNVDLMKDLTKTITQSREGTKSNIITGE
tara:strand:+ start:773 stop:1006 length:234 start_codon:yes stop_codon:yes gene_type:complete